MKNFSRLLALLLALCLMGGCALAELPELPASEEAEVESESVAEDTAQEDTVLAVVNGENLMQSDVDSYAYYLLYLYYSQGFDITDPRADRVHSAGSHPGQRGAGRVLPEGKGAGL